MSIFKVIAVEEALFLLKLFEITLFGKALDKFIILRRCGKNGKLIILILM